MKALSILIILVASANVSQATVYTLCNMPYSPGQFTTYFDAENAAMDGDTIYVHGSNFSYGDISIFRRLVIIGTGHSPNKQAPIVSTFGSISINVPNVQLIGLTFNSVESFDPNGTVKKCRILGRTIYPSLNLFASNWLIEGNIFDQQNLSSHCIRFSGYGGHIVQHNIFASNVSQISDISGSPGDRSYILNNVFLGNGASISSLSNLDYAIIRNNIFYGSSPDLNNSLTNAIIENNITFYCADNNFYPTATYGPLNQIGVDPLFTNVSGYPTNLFLYTYDFTLQPTSPGRNYGTDGTDVGVHGGLGELFTMTGEPSIAEVTAFTITSPTTIVPGGTLTISVTSKRVH